MYQASTTHTVRLSFICAQCFSKYQLSAIGVRKVNNGEQKLRKKNMTKIVATSSLSVVCLTVFDYNAAANAIRDCSAIVLYFLI